jgi:hypothetical protein
MRIASWKYRAYVPGFEFPDSIRARQAAYDERWAQMLEAVADRVANNRHWTAPERENSEELLNRTIEETYAEESRGLPSERAQSFITLMRGIAELTTPLMSEIAEEFRSHAALN